MTEAALVRKYERLAGWIARDFYATGLDRDDLRQEAMLGLLKAIRSYEPGHASFKTFAGICIRRHLISVLVTARRQKRLVELAAPTILDDGEAVAAIDLVESAGADPVDVLALREEVRRLFTVIRDELTPLERDCVIGLAIGLSYAELDAAHKKTTDNAVQRARLKLKAAA